MTKRVYFYKNISKVLPNHTMSLSKRQPFSHSGSGRYNTIFLWKIPTIHKAEFQITSLQFWGIL